MFCRYLVSTVLLLVTLGLQDLCCGAESPAAKRKSSPEEQQVSPVAKRLRSSAFFSPRKRELPGPIKLGYVGVVPQHMMRVYESKIGPYSAYQEHYDDFIGSIHHYAGQNFHPRQKAFFIMLNMILNNGKIVSDYSARERADALNKDLIEKLGHSEKESIRDLVHAESHHSFYLEDRYFRDLRADLKAAFDFLVQYTVRDHIIHQHNFASWMQLVVSNAHDAKRFHVDHIMPKSQSGSNSLANAAICSAKLNIRKSDTICHHLNQVDHVEVPYKLLEASVRRVL